MINTERLFIKQLSEEDTRFILELLNTEGWIKYIGNRNVNSENDAVAYIQKINQNTDITYWTVSLNQTKKSIGLVTLIKRDYLEYNDIGFAFLPDFSGKGYAYEAVNAVLRNLEEYNSLENILAITLPKNTTSIKLLEKLGFKFDRIIKQNNENLYLYNASKICV